MKHLVVAARNLDMNAALNYVRDYYQDICLERQLELATGDPDQELMDILNGQIAELERLAPWVKEACR